MAFQPVGERTNAGLFPGPQPSKFLYREDAVIENGKQIKWIGRWTMHDQDTTLAQAIVDSLQQEPTPHHLFSAYQTSEPSEMMINLECHTDMESRPQVMLHMVLQRLLLQCSSLRQQITTSNDNKDNKSIRLTMLEQTTRKWLFQLENTTEGFVNGFRRVVNGFLPALAIERVQFAKDGNTSVMTDPNLEHRLQMVPIRSDIGVKRLIYPDQCNCGDGCSKCQVKLTLNVKNTDPTRVMEITDLDLVSEDVSVRPASQCVTDNEHLLQYGHVKYKGTQTVFDSRGITLLKLAPGDHINLVAFVKKGIPNKHAAFRAAGMGYRHKFHVQLNSKVVQDAKLSPEENRKVVKSCSAQVFGLRPQSKTCPDIEELFIQNTNACNGCRECFSTSTSLLRERKMDVTTQSIVSSDVVAGSFRVWIENDLGMLPPADIFHSGLQEMEKMLIHVLKCNAQAKPVKVVKDDPMV